MRRRQPRGEQDEWPVPLQQGHAASTVGAESDEAPAAAVLWLPDPEQRRGWREYYVRRTADKPGARQVGFGKEV